METENAVLTEAVVHEDQLRTLINAFRLVSVSLDLKETLHGILMAVQKLIPYDAAGVFVFDPGSVSLRGFEVIGYQTELTQTASVCCGKGIIGHVLETGKGVVVSDVSRDPHYIRAREQTQSELAAPLIGSGGRAIGVINLESNLPHAYDHADLQLLEMMNDEQIRKRFFNSSFIIHHSSFR